jgi:hypothetical protein
MVLAHIETAGPQQTYASYAEHHLLFESVDLVTTVEKMGNGPIVRMIFVEVGVQQNDRLPPLHPPFKHV